MGLAEHRMVFTAMVARLINRMLESGYSPCLGKDGLKHMKNSLHYEGLAVDIDLFKDGKYLTNTEDHRTFGEFWKSLSPLAAWGGDFKDGNHYSLSYGGRK